MLTERPFIVISAVLIVILAVVIVMLIQCLRVKANCIDRRKQDISPNPGRRADDEQQKLITQLTRETKFRGIEECDCVFCRQTKRIYYSLTRKKR